MSEIAYLGIKGHVVAFEVQTGREVWRTLVRSSSITNVVPCGDVLLVYAKGHLFGLKKTTGQKLWGNSLDGLGYGFGLIATEGTQNAAVASAIAAQQQAASAATAAAVAGATAAS